MKTSPPRSESSNGLTTPFQLLLFCCFFIASNPSFSQFYISGPQNVCPQLTGTSQTAYTYTVHNKPAHTILKAQFGNIYHGTILSIDQIANTITVSFGGFVDRNVDLFVDARGENYYLSFGTDEINIKVSVKKPSSPNGGNILVCSNDGPFVNLTTTIGNDLGCKFHCDYTWTAPPGMTLQAPGHSGSEITIGNSVVPALFTNGVPNGYSGTVKVAAKWSQCGLDGDTYGYADVFSGPPLLNPTIDGVPSQGYNCVTNGALLVVNNQPHTSSVTWNKIGGNGTISPNGVSCYANPNGFMAVQVTANNRCGTSTYTYYLNDCSTSNYRISPNPAVSEITIDFEHKEFAEGLLESIELLDLDGKSYSKTNFKDESQKGYFKEKKSFTIDTKNLKRGNYVLHLDFGKFKDKKQIILK